MYLRICGSVCIAVLMLFCVYLGIEMASCCFSRKITFHLANFSIFSFVFFPLFCASVWTKRKCVTCFSSWTPVQLMEWLTARNGIKIHKSQRDDSLIHLRIVARMSLEETKTIVTQCDLPKIHISTLRNQSIIHIISNKIYVTFVYLL